MLAAKDAHGALLAIDVVLAVQPELGGLAWITELQVTPHGFFYIQGLKLDMNQAGLSST